MKRNISIFFIFLFFLCTSTVYAQKFSAQTLKKMSTFISNFTESYNTNFNVQQLRMAKDYSFFIDFGVAHTFINYENRRVTYKGYDGFIDKKWVKEAIKKYFDYDIPRFQSTREYKYDGKNFIFARGDGEARTYARVTAAKQISNNTIEMKGYLYNVETNERTGQKFVALAKPHNFKGRQTWAILSLHTN